MSESKLAQIFFPYAFERRRLAVEKKTRFVHYSSAEAAVKLITNREVWMRKARCMNDFSEIDYGMRCLRDAVHSPEGSYLRTTLDALFPGLFHEVAKAFDGWRPSILENTYVTCLSEHHSPKEDELGRLSMWRAYGGATGVAIVVSPTPFLVESDALQAYSNPVGYFTPPEFHQKFTEMVRRVVAEQSFLQGIGRDEVRNRLFNAFVFAATCTKHPGFDEELEWRVTHNPNMHPSPHLTKSIKTIRGVPQPVYKIPLRNIPAAVPIERLDGIEIPQFVERVIIGPTQYPTAVFEAIVAKLEQAGIVDARKRVVISGIPLRQ
jgi:Protein of unknown function (DUF2971)